MKESSENQSGTGSEFLQPSCSQWWREFEGKCVACIHSRPSNRRHEVVCMLRKAANHGLRDRPGGTWMGESVHKLFGCVYFQSANTQEKANAISEILDHSCEGAENGCLYCGEVNEIASRLLANSVIRCHSDESTKSTATSDRL